VNPSPVHRPHLYCRSVLCGNDTALLILVKNSYFILFVWFLLIDYMQVLFVIILYGYYTEALRIAETVVFIFFCCCFNDVL
jgi:small-conductance mechanosensitive channel